MTDVNTRTSVRRYRESEKNQVWRVHDRALRESEMEFSPEYNRYLRHVESEFLDADGEFLVAVEADEAGNPPSRGASDAAAGRVVAIGGYQPLSHLSATRPGDLPPFSVESVRTTARVRSVAVLPEFQSRGLGTELMGELESRAAASDLVRLVLKTGIRLKRARRFYESLAYREVRRDASDRGARYAWYEKRLRA